MKQIFTKNASAATGLLLFGSLAILLLLLDTKTEVFRTVHQLLLGLSTPVYRAAGLPGRVVEWVDGTWESRQSLQTENMALRTENFVLQQKVQKMAALIAENSRLNDLLNAGNRVDEDVVIARLIGESADAHRQILLLDKGSADGVKVGQAVLDADGLAGQIIEVSGHSSRVMMIVDSESAVPVQLLRTGTRFIAEGLGNSALMRLRYVAATADIVEGDVLLSSGLDGHYPPNYPVAKVSRVEHDPGQPFLVVEVVPLAQLDRSRNFLLLTNRKKDPSSE
jgi:rod shape-determining protein MreC